MLDIFWTYTHIALSPPKKSAKYLQRKCNDQDHGEVPMAHGVVA